MVRRTADRRGTHHFQLFLHFARDLDRLLPDLLHREYPALVDPDLGVNHGVTKVSVGIRAQGDLAGPHDWLRRRLSTGPLLF